MKQKEKMISSCYDYDNFTRKKFTMYKLTETKFRAGFECQHDLCREIDNR